MIPRIITDEEIVAITTLIQRAENIGSEAYTEEEIHSAIKTVFESRPIERAKDCDTKWIIGFMAEVKEKLDRDFSLSGFRPKVIAAHMACEQIEEKKIT